MNITPKGAPAASPEVPSPQQSAKERAVAKFLQPSNHSQQLNQNAIAPEDVGAVRQSDNTVATPEPQQKAPEPAKAEEPLSSQYAVLARKEKALRARVQAQEQAYKQREAALIAREEALKAKDGEYATKYVPRDRLQQDTINTLLEAGLTYDKITEAMLSQPQDNISSHPVVKQLMQKIATLEGKTESAEKNYQEQQTQQYQQALSQIRLEAKNLVQADPVAFEAIRATGSVKDVVDLIERTFKESGELLTVEDAAREVEEYLTEEATKLARLKKIQQRLTASQKPTPSATETKPKEQQQLKTLTNAVGASGKLSARERALLAFKGELKS